jgi:predicted peptidase
MKKTIIAVIFVLLSVSPSSAANVSDFLDFSLRAADNSLLMPGRLYVPPDSSSGEPRPLILFLHGGGEMGTNNTSQVNGNIDNLLNAAKARGAFVLAPQTNAGWHAQFMTSYAAELTLDALDQFNVDERRVYVTGLSMGGGGVWNMVHRYGDLFAAAVPICALLPSNDFDPAGALDEPIWAFHARNDDVVPVTNTRTMIDRILEAAGKPLPAYPSLNSTAFYLFDNDQPDLHYLELPVGGHGIWAYAYNQPRMYDWMFAQVQVPEPSTIWLLSASLCCILGYRVRCRAY